MIDVYGVFLRCDEAVERAAYREALWSATTEDRRERATAYRRPMDELRCLAAGCLLRYALLKAGCDLQMAQVPLLQTDPYGKPRLVGMPAFHYNLSHGGNWVVIACANTPVGVDVENVEASRDLTAMAWRFFTEEERAYIQDAPTMEEWTARWYEVWTAKESCLKYTGLGLSGGLASCSVVETSGGIRRLVQGRFPQAAAGRRVYLRSFVLGHRHCLSVCGESPFVEINALTAWELAAEVCSERS